MSQTIYGLIDPQTTSGNMLAAMLTDLKEAMVSGFSGATRPTELDPGGIWVDTSNDASGLWSLKIWTGSVDILIATINKTSGKAAITESDAFFNIEKVSADTYGAVLGLLKKRISGGGQVLDGDTVGGIEYKAYSDTGVAQVVAKIEVVSTDDVTNTARGSYLRFYTTTDGTANLSEKVRITDDGKVGIGITGPVEKLEVDGNIKGTIGKFTSKVETVAVESATVTTTGDVIVGGNLTVNGTTTTVNTENLETEDASILVNKGGTQASANLAVAGITVEMSDATDFQIGYASTVASKVVAGEVGALKELVNIDSAQTLTNKTITAAGNSITGLQHGVGVDNPTSGVHGVVGTLVGNSDLQTLTNKTIVGNANTISGLRHGTEVDNQSSGVHGVVGSVVGSTDAQTLTNKTIVGVNNSISGLRHGVEVDSLASGVHGVTGNVVGTSDAQELSNKSIVSPTKLEGRKDTRANLEAYAASGATAGQLLYATDENKWYGPIGGALTPISSSSGGGGSTSSVEKQVTLNILNTGIDQTLSDLSHKSFSLDYYISRKITPSYMAKDILYTGFFRKNYDSPPYLAENEVPYTVLEAASGKYYMGTSSSLIRVNADFTKDYTYSSGLPIAALLIKITVQCPLTGNIFCMSTGTYTAGVYIGVLACDSSGVFNSALTEAISGTSSVSKFSAYPQAIAIQSDGKILVGGNFTNYAGTTGRNCLIRLNSDGTLDTDFCANAVDGTKFSASIYAIAIQSDGKILVGGDFTNYAGTTGRNRLICLNSDGTLDTDFCANAVDGTKFSAAIFSIAIQSDGKILVGGNFITYAMTSGRNRLIRLNSDGTFNLAMLSTVNNVVRKIVCMGNGDIVIIGGFTAYTVGTVTVDSGLVLATDLTVKVTESINFAYTKRVPSFVQVSLGSISGTLYISKDGPGTNYKSAITTGLVMRSIASSYNRVLPPALAHSINGPVRQIIKLPDGGYLFYGFFSDCSGVINSDVLVKTDSQFVVDTVFSNNIKDLFYMTGGPLIAQIGSIAVHSDGSIVVGFPRTIYAQPNLGAKYAVVKLLPNGTIDPSFVKPFINTTTTDISAIAIQSDGKIFVGGNFATYAGTTGRNFLIRLNSDGTLDTAFCANAVDGSKFSNTIYVTAIQSDGKILVGGYFTNYAGTTGRNYLIRLNSDGTLDTAFCANAADGSKFTSYIDAIAIQPNGRILVAGSFTNYAGTTGRNFLIRLNSDGTLDTAFCANATDGSKFTSSIYAIAIQPNGRILVGGSFATYGGVDKHCLIALTSTGAEDTQFYNNILSVATYLSPLHYVWGLFSDPINSRVIVSSALVRPSSPLLPNGDPMGYLGTYFGDLGTTYDERKSGTLRGMVNRSGVVSALTEPITSQGSSEIVLSVNASGEFEYTTTVQYPEHQDVDAPILDNVIRSTLTEI